MTREELEEYRTYYRIIDWDAEVSRLTDAVNGSDPETPCLLEVLRSEERLVRATMERLPAELASRIHLRLVGTN